MQGYGLGLRCLHRVIAFTHMTQHLPHDWNAPEGPIKSSPERQSPLRPFHPPSPPTLPLPNEMGIYRLDYLGGKVLGGQVGKAALVARRHLGRHAVLAIHHLSRMGHEGLQISGFEHGPAQAQSCFRRCFCRCTNRIVGARDAWPKPSSATPTSVPPFLPPVPGPMHAAPCRRRWPARLPAARGWRRACRPRSPAGRGRAGAGRRGAQRRAAPAGASAVRRAMAAMNREGVGAGGREALKEAAQQHLMRARRLWLQSAGRPATMHCSPSLAQA